MSTDPEACRHLSINVLRDEEHDITIWACEDCRRRFYPACGVCVDLGHRQGHGEHIEPDRSGDDFEDIQHIIERIHFMALHGGTDMGYTATEADEKNPSSGLKWPYKGV